jgi:hypothetical protein
MCVRTDTRACQIAKTKDSAGLNKPDDWLEQQVSDDAVMCVDHTSECVRA